MKGVPAAATKWIRKSKKCKMSKENECFSQMPRGLFGVHFGLSFFCLPILRPQDGPGERIMFIEKTNGFSHVFAEIALPCSAALVWLGAVSAPCLRQWDPKNIPNSLKIMVWAILGRPLLGEPSGPSGCKKGSHAAWRSFRFAPKRSHAAWHSFLNFGCSLSCSMLGPAGASETL